MPTPLTTNQGNALSGSPHSKSVSSVLEELGVRAEFGLTPSGAARRLHEHGRNELLERGSRSAWLILFEQFASYLVIVLIVAAAVSALLGDYEDSIAIAAIVVLNAALGFTQDFRAEKTLATLKKLAVPSAKVRRAGEIVSIPMSEIAPGDIVFLESGNLVPADARVIESHELQTHEATLTGESQPIKKIIETLDKPDLPLGERHNMVYMGTSVAVGRGVAAVTATGMRTELGHIAGLVQSVSREPTPLQRRLHGLGKNLAAAALLLIAVIFVHGLLQGENWRVMFLTAVSMGVAAIPEGLPAVVTIALALGSRRLLQRHALIRTLPKVETLGSVTVICTDKTGTLTENRMRVANLWVEDRSYELEQHSSVAALGDGRGLMLVGGALCNDSIVNSNQSSAAAIGDPTEVALVSIAADFGLQKQELEGTFPRVAEIPFSSERKRMTTVHRITSDPSPLVPQFVAALEGSKPAYVAFCKGAADSVLRLSTHVLISDDVQPLDQQRLEHISAVEAELAQKGMRVIALAFRRLNALPLAAELSAVEQSMIFVGLFGLVDPPRPEAAPAVARCRAAGIRPVMITGDHPLTGRYIAEKVGIADSASLISGPELDRLAERLDSLVESTNVYARVAPAHKLKIVEALQRRGEVVAMTGDGVNDAPALKKADIGIAMGVTGTDVAKETADIVLLDDNFATIVSAVEEGRGIYDNIRKFIRYILATNSGEIWTMLVGPFLGLQLPLLPLQILWMNLVTDGAPALALAVEPAEPDTMRRPPYAPNESVFARGMTLHIVWVGIFMAFLSLGAGFEYWHANRANWQTMLFTTLTLSQMAHVLAIRSERKSLFQIGLLSNKALLGAVVLTVVLQICLIYVPFLEKVFHTSPLSAVDLGISLLLSAAVFGAVELEKFLRRFREPRAS
jgi:Ca2+-transporting ATPase